MTLAASSPRTNLWTKAAITHLGAPSGGSNREALHRWEKAHRGHRIESGNFARELHESRERRLHSQANRIEVEVRYDPREQRVRIRDNGKGIDPKVLEEGGRVGH